MRIIVDAYGGDHAPIEVLKGCEMAVKEYGVEVALCGREHDLRAVMSEQGISSDGFCILEAADVIPVEVDPTELLKTYKDSSMAVGLRSLADGHGDAFVTAGSTGAVIVGATLIVKRIKGVRRAAIGVVMPNPVGCYMLMDGGANSECRPEMLLQFGIMGDVYMRHIQGVDNPRVGLVNIGTEDTKGNELQVEAHKLLQNSSLCFVGNVEARELPLGGCDVAVADGFTGNIILKLTEGMGKMMFTELKRMLTATATAKIAAGLIKGNLADFKNRMDYTEYGGAPLMGISQPVIKAHGSSNAKAIKNAIRQAKTVREQNVIGLIGQSVSSLSQE